LLALQSGRITFSCLKRPKITDAALALWLQVLQSIPGSRLMLLAGSTDGRNSFLRQRLARHGYADAQIELTPRARREQYLRMVNRIDIALDPFPYNGEATSLDGLWMGVPLITLVGNSTVSRRGGSHLSTLGLGNLVADSPDEYVRCAAGLAADMPRLSKLRQTLRSRIKASRLADGAAYTNSLEAKLRQACGYRGEAAEMDLPQTGQLRIAPPQRDLLDRNVKSIRIFYWTFSSARWYTTAFPVVWHNRAFLYGH
jgi:protein O-GlcNAc transferase